jgi:hypothetical protein
LITNLLTASEQGGDDGDLWYAAQNCVVSRSSERYLNEPAAIKVEPITQGGPDMVVDLVRSLSVTPNTPYRCFAFFCGYCAFGAQASVVPKLYDSSGNLISTSFSGSKRLEFNTWTLISVQFTTPANAVSGRISFSVEANRTVFFDQVGFVRWQRESTASQPADPIDNDFSKFVMTRIPEYMRVEDQTHSGPDRHLERFVDVFTVQADQILTSARAFNYIPEADGFPGFQRSTLVDPDYYPEPLTADPSWLPWLAQLVGVSPLGTSSGGSLTPWFFLESNYPDWNAWQEDVDPADNPTFSVTSIVRSSDTVTATITQTIGDPYTPAVNDGIEVTGTTDFDGAFIIQSVGSGTISWYQAGSDTSESSGTVIFSDASWGEIESLNPGAFEAVAVLKHLVRTGATGVNAGSRTAMIAAARATLEGFDSKATVSRSGNVLTIVSEDAHGLVVSDEFAIYMAGNRTINSESLTVASVVSPYEFTATQNGYDVAATDCMATNKIVELIDGPTVWELTMNTLEEQTYATDVLEAAVGAAKPVGMTVTYGFIT